MEEKTENGNSNIVNIHIRFINFIVDTFIIMILILIFSFIFFNVVGIPTLPFYIIFGILILFGIFISYYSIMEIKFQKTVGKFLTKTKVVKMNDERAENFEIIYRSFYRLIPFEQVSFLLTKNGIHDFLSKTKVITDKKE